MNFSSMLVSLKESRSMSDLLLLDPFDTREGGIGLARKHASR